MPVLAKQISPGYGSRSVAFAEVGYIQATVICLDVLVDLSCRNIHPQSLDIAHGNEASSLQTTTEHDDASNES